MKVLVTGGAGFIGTNLRRRLEDEVTVSKVVLLDDLSSGYRDNLNGHSDKVFFVEGSINDGHLLKDIISEVEAVVHLAARPSVARSIEDPEATTRANVHGTLSVLEAIRQTGRDIHFVYASSSSVYGSNPVLPKHEAMATFPVSPYAASKLAGEVYALAYQTSFGIPVTAFRFFNVYGPYQRPGHAYAAVVPAFLEALLKNRPLPVHGDGLQTRDFTYVGTLVDALTKVVTRRATSHRPINLAFGTRTNLLELIRLMEDVTGESSMLAFEASRHGDVRDSQASNESLMDLLPDLEAVSLESGLRDTFNWMRQFLAVTDE